MNDFTFEVDRSVPLRNALVVTAFPTLGNVSSIAVRFLTDVTHLKRIGCVYSPRLPPLAGIHDGNPQAPIEVYAAEHRCGMGKPCDSLVVVTSDMKVPEEVQHDLALSILDWSREVGSGEVAVLEGARVPATDGASGLALKAVATTQMGRERLRKQDIELLTEGFIGGVSGVLLHRGKAIDVDVYGLLAVAADSKPDAQAAADLVRALERLFLKGTLNMEKLDEAVAKAEGSVKKRQTAVKQQLRRDVAYT